MADCVRRNGDKGDPAAYCATIMRAAEKAMTDDNLYVIKAPTASVDGTEHPASDFAYVPDPEMSSTWKFPIFDAAHARNALARFDQANLPAAAKAGVRAKIEAAAAKHGVQVSQKGFEITKLDEERQLVFGWASVAVAKDGKMVLDLQGDLISPAELESAAYGHVLMGGDANEMHTEERVGQVVESFVVTPDKLEKMGLAKDALPQGWWYGIYIENPDVFARVKSGELKAFSIEGSGERRAAFA